MSDKYDILDEFGLGDDESRIFAFLIAHPQTSVAELALNVGIKRTTLYGLIEKLKNKGIVTESEKDGVKSYSAVTKEKLEVLIEERIAKLKGAKQSVAELFASTKAGELLATDIQIYRGKEGIKFILQDMLLKKNIETEAFWPIKTMLDVLGAEFFKYLNKERIKRNIFTKAIWPRSQVVDTKNHPYLGSGEEFLREIRVAPEQVDFSMGYWIYDDRVAFISSSKESFGFIIKSREMADVLRVQHSLIWQLSKPLLQKDNPEVEKFLGELYL
jgi:sugar-specific transcriptional regulator TrmB